MRALAIPKITAAISIIGLSLAGFAHAANYAPARLGNAVDHIEQTVTPPVLSNGLAVASVYCQADVNVAGITSNVVCYEKEGRDELRDQTAAAMTGRTITPATVDGTAVPVRMYFRVVYSDLQDQPPVLVLPNLGNMQDKYGFHYTAPQERLDKGPWFEGYSANDWAKGAMFFSNEGRLTRYVAIVDESGKPIAVRRIESSKRNKRDSVEMEKQLQDSRFIPGFANGQPERMQYVAVLHFPQ